MSDRQITAAPMPPESFDEGEAMAWFDIVLPLLQEGRLHTDKLPAIEKLAVLEAERTRLQSTLGLELETLDYELLSIEGFDRRFESYLSKFDTYQAAYEQVEFEHELNFNHRKYAGYESFRVARSRRKNKAS